MSRYLSLCWFSLSLVAIATVGLCSSLWAQAAPEPASVSSEYVARIERGQGSEDVCALIGRNGQYRLERLFPRKTDVFVGTLSPEQLHSVEQMLDQDSLTRLSPVDIRNPLVTDSFDLFQLDVFRPGGLQHLSFRDGSSRKPFRDSLTPILSWFDQLRKLPHTQIAESSASHCMPAIPDLQNSGSQLKLIAPPDRGYFLTWGADSFHRGLVERSCIIVYTDGRYRIEKSTQRYLEAMSTRAYEDTLTRTQTADLQTILASPDLATLKHGFEQTRPASDLEITRFVIPRETAIQRLSFGSDFNVIGSPRQAGGMSNLQYGVDQERNVIRPLQKWLEKTIESSKALMQTDTRATNCTPSQ
jgi:hypothetical protein